MNKLTFKAKIFTKILLIATIVFCVFLSDTSFGQIRTSDPEKILNLIEGEWDWVSTYGGYTGKDYFTPATEGYTLKYKFVKIENVSDSIEYWFFKNDSELYHSKAKFRYFNDMYGANYWYFDYLYGEMMGGNLKFGFYDVDTLYFSDNGYDGYGSSYAKSNLSGVNIAEKNTSLLYPNPTDGMVHFNGIEQIKFLEIVDLSGQVLFQKKDIQKNLLDIRHLEVGIYMIHIQYEDNKEMVEKIILKK